MPKQDETLKAILEKLNSIEDQMKKWQLPPGTAEIVAELNKPCLQFRWFQVKDYANPFSVTSAPISSVNRTISILVEEPYRSGNIRQSTRNVEIKPTLFGNGLYIPHLNDPDRTFVAVDISPLSRRVEFEYVNYGQLRVTVSPSASGVTVDAFTASKTPTEPPKVETKTLRGDISRIRFEANAEAYIYRICSYPE